MAQIPKHENPTLHNRTAHAPYNFVPLPEKVVTVEGVPPQDVYSGYTGYIECLLTTESPLYTRSGMNPDLFKNWGDRPFHELPEVEKEKRARFFHLDDVQVPVIPGSSLRGALRSLIEIVGYAKVHWVSDQQLIYRAVGDSSSLGDYYRAQMLGRNKACRPHTLLDYPSLRLKGGYLKRIGSGWAIQPATDHLGESFIHVEYSDAQPITGGHGKQQVYSVFVRPASRVVSNRGQRGPGNLSLNLAITTRIVARSTGASPPHGLVPATLVESGHMGGTHAKHWHCAIYEPDPHSQLIAIPDELWAVYREDRDLTRGLATRKLEHGGDPLFYLMDSSGLVFFGPTMMFRLPYPNSPVDLVPDHLRCERDLDLAEAVFGFVKSSGVPAEDRSLAGRVFFTDAVFLSAQDGVWATNQFVSPKILGSPKPTSFQNYLTQQEPDDRKQLDHYASPPPHDTVVRGHKLYWHRDKIGIDDLRENDQRALGEHASQYTGIKPVKEGVTFRFYIHFENLRDFELGALLWVLMLPGEPGKKYRHKLGMGKPLGMGSVHLQPRLNISTRNGKTGRYSRLFSRSEDNQVLHQWHTGETEDAAQRFIQAFEQYVLLRMDQVERGGVSSLKDVSRVRMLLKMLEWPGPGRTRTEYMALARFRQRPVLPDPLEVAKLTARRGRPGRLQAIVVGMTLTGTVTRIESYGAFVDIGVERDGLLHISELSDGWVQNVEDVVRIGQTVRVRVLDVDLERRRVSLTLKRVPQGPTL